MSASSSSTSSWGRRGRGRVRRLRRRGGDEACSSSDDNGNGNGNDDERLNTEEWPEPFLESLTCQVAHEATQNLGPLEAAAAISNLFQVCSTWRTISRSEHLWQTLTRHIWQCDHLVHRQTWRDEYLFRHRLASNFQRGRAVYANIRLAQEEDDQDVVDNLTCRRLAFSDSHLACGLIDGSVRIFQLSTRLHIATYRPQPRDRLGHYSRSVSGIILSSDLLVFASLDGDVHVAVIGGCSATHRRVHLGNVVNDGTLVDFTGCSRWWVGLYAGVPARSFHIWNAETEQLVFVGGSLTDPESVMGWHLLNELNESVGRVRILSSRSTASSTVVAATSLGLVFLDVRGDGEITITSNEAAERGVIVDSLDLDNTQRLLLVVDNRRVARICRVADFEEVCRFRMRSGGLLLGCINSGCAFIWTGAAGVRAWDTRRGQLLYNLTDSIRDPTALASDERYVALVTRDSTVHFWDFGVI